MDGGGLTVDPRRWRLAPSWGEPRKIGVDAVTAARDRTPQTGNVAARYRSQVGTPPERYRPQVGNDAGPVTTPGGYTAG
jgi:hypothetical protein